MINLLILVRPATPRRLNTINTSSLFPAGFMFLITLSMLFQVSYDTTNAVPTNAATTTNTYRNVVAEVHMFGKNYRITLPQPLKLTDGIQTGSAISRAVIAEARRNA